MEGKLLRKQEGQEEGRKLRSESSCGSAKPPTLGNGCLLLSTLKADAVFAVLGCPVFFLGSNPFLFL